MDAKTKTDPAITAGGYACIELLKQTLADAEEGRITTVGIIACGPADFGSAHAGSDAARLNMGLDVLKRTILEKVAPPAPRGPTILRR